MLRDNEALQILEEYAGVEGLVQEYPYGDVQLVEAVIQHADNGWMEADHLHAALNDAVEAFDQWVRNGCEYHPLMIEELMSKFSDARDILDQKG